MTNQNVSNVKPFPLNHQTAFCDYAGGRFKVSDKGLYFLGKDKDGIDLPPRWICSPLYVIAKTRDAKSGEWGRLLEWQDDDGFKHQWAMPISLLQGDASKAVSVCFKAWIDSFGASRFDDIKFPNNERIHNRAGFYRDSENEDREYLILSEIFKNEICKGFDFKTVINVLSKKGWLVPGNDGKNSQKPRIRGIGMPRCYVFTGKMWEDEEGF